MRCAIYLRISQDKTGEAAGVTRQREDCEALATELGWQIFDVYQDNDVSATSGKVRPQYRRMLGDIDAGHIEAVIAWHTDRLYRRLVDLEELIPACEKRRVVIRTVRAGDLDLSTPTGRMLARILGSVAGHEVEQKADRWLRSYAQRRQAGQWMASGPRTFGYERDGTIRPDEATAIAQAASDILSGMTRFDVCRRLNAAGMRTTRGKLWSPTSLRVLLTNPRLAGLVTVKGEIIGVGTWEPILDRGTWEQLCALIDKRRDGRTRSPARSLLSGIVVCGYPVDGKACGTHLTRGKSSMPIYRCRTAALSNRHVTISAPAVEELVEAYAREKLADDKVRSRLAARLSSAGTVAATLTREIDDLEQEIGEREREIEQASASRARLAAMRAIDELDARLQEKRAQLARIVPATIPVGDEWPEDVGRRSALIRLVVTSVVVRPVTRHDRRFDPARVQVVPAETGDPYDP